MAFGHVNSTVGLGSKGMGLVGLGAFSRAYGKNIRRHVAELPVDSLAEFA